MIGRTKIRILAASALAVSALVTGTVLAQTHEGAAPAASANDAHHLAPPAELGEKPAAAAHHEGAAHEALGEKVSEGAHAAADDHATQEAAGVEGAGAHGEHHEGAAHESAAHEGGHHGPAPINWTDLSDKSRPAFIALLINFLLLAGLYYTMGKKPVAEGLKQRRVTIGKEIEDARAMLGEANKRAEKYQGNLKNADADAITAKTSLVAAGKGEVEQLLLEAEERADRMQRDASRLVEQERKQLQHDLHIETVELAVKEAQELLERNKTPEDHARLANELLAELSRKPAAARFQGGAS